MGETVMRATSKHLNERQLAAIERIGDVLVPGDGELDSFSRSGCVRHVDRVLGYMPASDLEDLKTLLSILAVLPAPVIALVLRLLEGSPFVPGQAGGILRLIRIGLRGLVMTLYFGDGAVLEKLGYRVGVYSEDLSTK